MNSRRHLLAHILFLLPLLSACEQQATEKTGSQQQESARPANNALAKEESTAGQKTALPEMPTETKLVGHWHSYSHIPPTYAMDEVLLFNNRTCEIRKNKRPVKPSFCYWKRTEGLNIEIYAGPSNEQVKKLEGTLQSSRSMIKENSSDARARYMTIKLNDTHRQQFVLGATADAKMVFTEVTAEAELKNKNYQKAVSRYYEAIDLGSVHARIRLGLIHATTKEYLDPAKALELLQPISNRNHYGILTAVAAAYAANGNFEKAIDVATSSCTLVKKNQNAFKQCNQRLEIYKSHIPLVLTLESLGG